MDGKQEHQILTIRLLAALSPLLVHASLIES
jgi:hypothetical protein